MATTRSADLVILAATPGGLTAAIAAARAGRSVLVAERSAHLGGLPANGLGATDIQTRAATGGLFREFTGRIRAAYVARYGEGSDQVRDCSDGYHFEPAVAEGVLEAWVAEHPAITVLRRRQFDVRGDRIEVAGGRIRAITVTDLDAGGDEELRGAVFIDASYEGDLAAAAGCPFRTRREDRDEYGESRAGVFYQAWGAAEAGTGTTGVGDARIQAYNYRLCLTDRADNRVPIPKPAGYDRTEYASLADDLVHDRVAGVHRGEQHWDGIGRIVNIVTLPNGKTDANNQHLAFLSTDLPEENQAWPTATWAWRDRFAARLRDYILGLLWFMQHDEAVPASFRSNAAAWGLAADEYADNGHFPRQVYVREGRRIEGERFFTASDALPTAPGARPPVHGDSITASHYAIDSHAVRKREPGRAHLDGFLSQRSEPYTVPYGVIVPRGIDNLLTPVPVSASHCGYGTLRMEPCWMALGHAAGLASDLALRDGLALRNVPVGELQLRLVAQGAVLLHLRDCGPGHPAWPAAQRLGLRGGLPEWELRPDAPCDDVTAARWASLLGAAVPRLTEPTTRGALLARLKA